ncbi:MAG: hypothetical protein ICV84_19900 [Flavisolibacter sp.]|nr:hypothetical protein [Flavisolibacter sp.]MBD0297423.1 hypothetical protein [Flavisolibacter sp.]
MKKEDSSRIHSDEQDKTNQAPGTGDEADHTSLTTEQRPAETHNTISNPDGDGMAENRVTTSLSED